MDHQSALTMIERRYADVHGAVPHFDFPCLAAYARDGVIGAALGFRRADVGELFLEAYLDAPVEVHLGALLGRPVARHDIVEIGNMAAETATAMVALWARAANDLGDQAEIAVAVLTSSLRTMLRRLGVTLHEIAPAQSHRLGAAAARWGRYYAQDPIVCAGFIAEGQAGLTRWARRQA